LAIVGIDLGTTYSLVGVFQDGAPRLVENVLGSRLTPSVVGLDDDGQVLVGQAARERLITHPGLTAATFKRYMGTDRLTQLGSRQFRPEELSSFVLRSLKADAEAVLGEPVTEAVISVPAYFADAQRKATRAAGELAGLKVERLINEPTAAALAYGLHEAQNETTFLIFDLGGGTFDVSIVELFQGIIEVHASAGDSFLGGEDFTAALASAFLESAGVTEGALELAEKSRLWRQAELAKQKLTVAETAEIQLTLQEREISWQASRTLLEDHTKELVERMRRPVERAMRDAQLGSADLDGIVLVGGATRMPLVRALAAKLFGRFPLTNVHPDEAVALGTAIQAGLKSRDKALAEVVLTDTSPHSLGVGVAIPNEHGEPIGQEFSPIIERNTVIPASREHSYSPIHAHQREVHFEIYQGESRRLENNVKLGSLRLPLPPGNAKERQLLVRFTYDINGLLEVDTKVAGTEVRRSLVIEGNPGFLPPEEIHKRLAQLQALKVHPRDQMENRTVLARGERIFEESLGERRLRVGALLARFDAVLARQDPREIPKARDELARELDELEQGPSW
jgi:molecular chaperone HscC